MLAPGSAINGLLASLPKSSEGIEESNFTVGLWVPHHFQVRDCLDLCEPHGEVRSVDVVLVEQYGVALVTFFSAVPPSALASLSTMCGEAIMVSRANRLKAGSFSGGVQLGTKEHWPFHRAAQFGEWYGELASVRQDTETTVAHFSDTRCAMRCYRGLQAMHQAAWPPPAAATPPALMPAVWEAEQAGDGCESPPSQALRPHMESAGAHPHAPRSYSGSPWPPVFPAAAGGWEPDRTESREPPAAQTPIRPGAQRAGRGPASTRGSSTDLLLIDPRRVEAGEDARCTVMLKNVPDTWTRERICALLDATVPGTYDCVILPLLPFRRHAADFAFVNFLAPRPVAAFHRACNGMVCEGKSEDGGPNVLQVRYSKLQGVRKLVKVWARLDTAVRCDRGQDGEPRRQGCHEHEEEDNGKSVASGGVQSNSTYSGPVSSGSSSAPPRRPAATAPRRGAPALQQASPSDTSSESGAQRIQ